MRGELGVFGYEVGQRLPAFEAVLACQGMLHLLQGDTRRQDLLVGRIPQACQVSQCPADTGVPVLVCLEECFGFVLDVIKIRPTGKGFRYNNLLSRYCLGSVIAGRKKVMSVFTLSRRTTSFPQTKRRP